jgi:ABC-type glycerol-3-phosphate transport system substrate-binding protein
MKKTIRLFILLALALPFAACSARAPKPESEMAASSGEKVEAYYFHFNARCVTCKTIEAEARADIESLYGGKVSFQSVNLDDAGSKALAEKLGVAGQTLLLVKGNTRVNITNEGFMYARSNPEKLRSIIKEKVDQLLK